MTIYLVMNKILKHNKTPIQMINNINKIMKTKQRNILAILDQN